MEESEGYKKKRTAVDRKMRQRARNERERSCKGKRRTARVAGAKNGKKKEKMQAARKAFFLRGFKEANCSEKPFKNLPENPSYK